MAGGRSQRARRVLGGAARDDLDRAGRLPATESDRSEIGDERSSKSVSLSAEATLFNVWTVAFTAPRSSRWIRFTSIPVREARSSWVILRWRRADCIRSPISRRTRRLCGERGTPFRVSSRGLRIPPH